MSCTTQTPIVVLGEALMDCIAQPHDSQGSFIPYEGGSPYNVARAIALQGGAVTFATPTSTDELGVRLSGLLKKDGVTLGLAANDLPTSLAMVSFVRGQPSYQFYREGVADRHFSAEQALTFLDTFPSPGILHTGSLALVPPEADKTLTIMKAAKARGWIISCDINLRPRLARDMDEYRTMIVQFIAASDWLKASDEDLTTLLGSPAGALGDDVFDWTVDDSNAAQVLPYLAAMGCQRIAITCGEHGAYLRVNEQTVHNPAPKVTVKDTVGCGDTFWGSCVLAWALGETAVVTTLNRALKAAAINASRAGCSPPTTDALKAVL